MATRRTLLLALTSLIPAALRASGWEYEAPPTLPYYLDRLPAKPLGQILSERAPAAPAPVERTDYAARLLALADAPPERALPAVDDLLAKARREPADAALLANLLNDARDVFTAAPPADAKARADYLRWRVGHADWFGLDRFLKDAPPRYRQSSQPEGEGEKTAAPRLAELEKRARDAGPGPLTAHWHYLVGALLFKAGEDAKSQGWFERVAAEHPGHPRAEAARYMVARCELSRSRPGDYASEPKPDAERRRAAARAGFEDYLKRYPDGRFAADVPGWLGALRFDAKDYLGALADYVRQAGAAGREHPETLKSAAFMAERCLSHLASTGDDAGLRAVAAQPPLALGLVYLVLNSPEADNYNNAFESPAAVARWRRALLPRLAEAIAARPELYQDADWQGAYLAALAQAASGAGDQGRALELVAMAPPGLLTTSDDLAFVRAVALARSGKLADAAGAFREFLKAFPRSTLAKGARLRLALALQDDHQAGAAAGELLALRDALRAEKHPANDRGEEGGSFTLDGQPSFFPFTDAGQDPRASVILPDPSGAEPEAVDQLLDTLLNFAPRPELAAGLANLPDGPARVRLAGALAQRALAEDEDFAEAKRYLTPAEWEPAAPVAAAAALPPTAENLLRLGDLWAAARGKLVFRPLQTEEGRTEAFTRGGYADADRTRRENARALGLPEARVNAALEGRDELRHARAHWLRAADAAPAGSPLRAQALWRALAATPKVALVSPFTLARAGETNLAGESRKLYDRLRRECPDAREAREFAVFYEFPKALGTLANARWETAREGEEAPTDDTAGATPDGSPAQPPEFAEEPDADAVARSAPAEDGATAWKLLPRLLALRERTADPARLAADVTALRREVRARLGERSDAVLLNCLDDLADFLAEPRVSPDAARRYVTLRLETLHTAVRGGVVTERWGLPKINGVGDNDADWRRHRSFDNGSFDGAGGKESSVDDLVLSHIRAAYREPALAPFKDFLDALAIAVIANHLVEVPVPGVEKDGHPFHYTSRDYPKIARLGEGFLKDYPKSRRREAVSLLRVRALYFAGRPGLYKRFAGWPESGHYDGGWVLAAHRQAAVDPRAVGAALNEHEREFPRGRYGNEIRHLRACPAWRTQQWDVALRLTLSELDDKNAPDLQADAAARLASIFTTLATDETERACLLAAIRAQPGAPERLRAHLEKAAPPLALVRTWALGELR